MELKNDFRVGVPPETAWNVLNDIERVAPCLPGAQLQEMVGDEYRGVVKIKVGPITAQYQGKAVFVEQDHAAGRVVLKASGRDTGGGGNANATITATMVADGDGTLVTVFTDLAITGRLAQFGRGVLAEVSAKLLDQFVARLEADVLTAARAGQQASSNATSEVVPASSTAPASLTAPAHGSVPGANSATTPEPPEAPEATDKPSIQRFDGPEVAPLDLFEAAGGSLARRALPVLAGLAGIVLIVVWRRQGR